MKGGEREMTQSLYHVYRHLQRVQHHFSFEVEDDHLDQLADWAWESNAVLFLPDGSVVDPSGEVLVDPADGSCHPEAQVPYPMDAIERKKRSEEQLKSLEIPVHDSLPPVIGGCELRLRSPEEVAHRALSLLAVAVRAEGLATDDALPVESTRERIPQAFDALSPVEAEFMKDDSPDKQTIVNHAWRYECLFVLQWALNLFDDLHFPTKICDVPAVAGAFFRNDPENIIATAKLRSSVEILDQLDLHLRLHWAVRNSSQQDEPAPAGIEAGVVHERRVALNWLVQFEDADWDDVDCPT